MAVVDMTLVHFFLSMINFAAVSEELLSIARSWAKGQAKICFLWSKLPCLRDADYAKFIPKTSSSITTVYSRLVPIELAELDGVDFDLAYSDRH